MKIFHATGSFGYSNWIPRSKIVYKVEDADLVMFSGGSDIGPYLYGDRRGKYTNDPDYQRDRFEMELFNYCLEHNKPMLGICRGSQLICALSGGKIIQHQSQRIENGIHTVFTNDGKLSITSSHHQAAFPYFMCEEDYEVIGWTTNQSLFHLNGNNVEISNNPFREVEICLYKNTRALGIQGHPERMDRNSYPETFAILDKLVERLLSTVPPLEKL
jgi:putative glutamine amidotransferase